MLKIILAELSAMGCEARVDDEGRLMISNASRIDSVLADAIKEHRGTIIASLTGGIESDWEEMDPVRCGSCGGDCDVYVLPDWLCKSCDEGCEDRRQATLSWLKHRKRILKTREANRA